MAGDRVILRALWPPQGSHGGAARLRSFINGNRKSRLAEKKTGLNNSSPWFMPGAFSFISNKPAPQIQFTERFGQHLRPPIPEPGQHPLNQKIGVSIGSPFNQGFEWSGGT